MKMNRISIVCLGVRDMERSLRFYRDGLGFATESEGYAHNVVFFSTPGTKFELCQMEMLRADINPEAPLQPAPGFGGITLAYNVHEKAEVEAVIELARAAGATIVKEPQDVFWGGYHAYFSDPDGYYWEVAYGPNFQYDENDLLVF